MSRNAKRRRNNRQRKQVAPRGNRNTTVTRTRRAPAAQTQIITNRGTLRTLRLSHKEMVDDIEIPETSGVLQTFEVNPGLPSCFPWLSQIAQRFETYNFNSLSFHWVTAVPTSTAGTIAIIPDYDPADDNSLASKKELLSFEDSVRGSWWSNFTMKSTPRNLRKRKAYYVRGQDLAANLDIKTYDVAQLHLYKSGTADTVGGELWVEYDISFHTPQMKHEGEALVQKGGEFSFTASPTGVLASLYDKVRKVDAFLDWWSGADAFLCQTPGAYFVTCYADDVSGGSAPSFGVDATYRDTNYTEEITAYDVGPPTSDAATGGIWEIFETGGFPNGNAALTIDNTFTASAVVTWIMHMSELLPDSPVRLAYEVRNSYLKELRKQGRDTKGVCLCARCMGVKNDHKAWEALKLRGCNLDKLKPKKVPAPKTDSKMKVVEVDGVSYNVIERC